jgi:hypothetical protein
MLLAPHTVVFPQFARSRNPGGSFTLKSCPLGVEKSSCFYSVKKEESGLKFPRIQLGVLSSADHLYR